MFQNFFLILVFCISCFSAVADVSYLDQTPPGDTPQLFAPGIVSNGFNNRDMAMTPDGSEFYFAVNMRNFDLSTILSMHKTEDLHSLPGQDHFYVLRIVLRIFDTGDRIFEAAQ